jgi:hypothetical protein
MFRQGIYIWRQSPLGLCLFVSDQEWMKKIGLTVLETFSLIEKEEQVCVQNDRR